MKTKLLIVAVASLVVFLEAGCVTKPGAVAMTAVPPGVVVANPISHPSGGDGMISVKFPASEQNLNGLVDWWVTPAHHKIPGSAIFVPGSYTVCFGLYPGYTAPGCKSAVVVVANMETIVTVTYGHP